MNFQKNCQQRISLEKSESSQNNWLKSFQNEFPLLIAKKFTEQVSKENHKFHINLPNKLLTDLQCISQRNCRKKFKTNYQKNLQKDFEINCQTS